MSWATCISDLRLEMDFSLSHIIKDRRLTSNESRRGQAEKKTFHAACIFCNLASKEFSWTGQ